MNQKPTRPTGSLLERAADAYDFGEILRGTPQPAPAAAAPAPAPAPILVPPVVAPPPPEPVARAAAPVIAANPPSETGLVRVDRAMLRDSGLIVPGAPPNGLSEEFRLIKRQLLLNALGGKSGEAVARGRRILVCSAHPNEGKTFSSVNLALSMASETEIEVLLVDADVAKPEILSTLGLAGGPGLMDALADPSLNPEDFIIRTDVPNLSILPTGRQTNNDTELLASDHTARVIDALAAQHPRRVILFDSAPALAASPASVLALHVGQVLLVVRADETPDSDIRDTLEMLDVGPLVQLMLNGVTYHAANRKFGSYYGFGD